MRALARTAVLGLSAALLCAAAAKKQPFPHKVHVADQEMACKSCHDLKSKANPELKTKGCGKCHDGKIPKYAPPKWAKGDPEKFGHPRHAEKAECAACHQATIADARKGNGPLVTPAQCDGCHAARPFLHKPHLGDGEVSCKACHDAKSDEQAVKSKSCHKCHDGTAPKFGSKKPGRGGGAAFTHGKHVEKVPECVTCHADVVADAQPATGPLMPAAGCAKCHDKPFSHKLHVGEQEAPCKSCHDVAAAESPPLKTKGCGKCHNGAVPPWGERKAKKEEGLRFPHAKHVEKAKCEDCHQDVLNDAHDPAQPLMTRAACKSCHSKPFSHKIHVGEQDAPCKSCHDLKSPEPKLKTKGCDKCHEMGPPDWVGPKAVKLAKVKFSHPAHAKVECADCHADVIADAHQDDQPLLPTADCARCHRERGVAVPSAACARCHGANLKRQLPDDHDGTWPARHGPEAGWRLDQHGRTCSDCHTPSTCTACHQQVAPSNHTGLWRLRAHGLAAAWDRDRCKACHQTGTCIRCHSDTKPINHGANWRQVHGLVADRVPNDECGVCHRPSWCAACHAGQ